MNDNNKKARQGVKFLSALKDKISFQALMKKNYKKFFSHPFLWAFRHTMLTSITLILTLGIILISVLYANSVNTKDSNPTFSNSYVQQGVPGTAQAVSMITNKFGGDTIKNPQTDNADIIVLTSTDFITALKDNRYKATGTAVIDQAHWVTGFPTIVEGLPTIVSAKYLEEQTSEILALYSKNNIPVETFSLISGSTSKTREAQNAQSYVSYSILGIIMFIALISGLVYMIRSRNNKKKQSKEDLALQGKTLSKNVGKIGKGTSDTPFQMYDNTGDNKITFADVAGVDEAIEELEEIVEFLKTPEKFEIMNVKPHKGALLLGPPGTGKTLLARAVAGEAGVPFYSASGSDFVEMYVGVGAKRVRQLFKEAQAHEEGAIIFIDEIDAVGRARGKGNSSNGEQESTLNALLVEMDGFHKSRIVVLAATNRDDILDKALMRPGRLDKKIHVPLPDRRGREKILLVHTELKPLADDVDMSTIAFRTPGMSGAELAQVVNEACLNAIKNNKQTVGVEDFDHAVATVVMGKARTSAVVSEKDKTITAWHEAGHTVAAMVLPETDDPVSVSIVPRGQAGGVTWMGGNDDQYLSRKKAYSRLIVSMAGRAAEEKLLDGEFTSGPHGDLQAATNLAWAMVTNYGMTPSGLMIRSDGLISTGAQATDEVVQEVENMLYEALSKARLVLEENFILFHNIVEALLSEETLSEADLLLLKEGHSLVSIPITKISVNRQVVNGKVFSINDSRVEEKVYKYTPQLVDSTVSENASLSETINVPLSKKKFFSAISKMINFSLRSRQNNSLEKMKSM